MAEPTKVVTLLPSATEIVGGLLPPDRLDRLVAVSHECDFPVAAVADRPRITGSIIPHGLSSAEIDAAVSAAFKAQQPLYRVNGDLLAELRPSLIVTQGLCDVCAVNANTVDETLMALPDALTDTLAETKVLSLTGQDLEGVLTDIERVGAALDRAEAAASWNANLRDRWQRLADSMPTQKPRVLMLEWNDPPFFGGHWVPEMVEVAGGVDVFGKPGQPSGRCTWDEIVASDPDIVLSIACGHNLEQNIELMHDLFERPEFHGLRAVRSGDLWAIDANSYFSRPAPRIVDGAEILREVFTGTMSGSMPDITGAARIQFRSRVGV
ncbi:MAG: ABC transporter substrate-binding protein [Geitlerinemataceae cyanobacterium]